MASIPQFCPGWEDTPFEDGNGRVVRMATHLQLTRIGLGSPLWSISRGLARKQDEYYARLSAADQGRRGGRGLRDHVFAYWHTEDTWRKLVSFCEVIKIYLQHLTPASSIVVR